jgi:hypothetical protein
MICREMRDWLRAGDSRCWDDAVRRAYSMQGVLYSVYVVLGVWCTWCMLYLVYAVLGVCCTRCMVYSVYAVLGVCCTWCLLLIMAWRDTEG